MLPAQVMAAAHRHDRARQCGLGDSASGACPFVRDLLALYFTIYTPYAQAFFPDRNMSAFKVPEDISWKQFFSMHRTLMELPLTCLHGRHDISQAMLNQVLADMRLAGKMAVCDLNVPFKLTFGLRPATWIEFFVFVHRACTTGQAGRAQAAVYNWWYTTVQELRQTAQVTLADAPPARKEAACASFDSFVKMVCKALTLLNRYYVKRLSLTTVEGVASPEQAALRQAFGV